MAGSQRPGSEKQGSATGQACKGQGNGRSVERTLASSPTMSAVAPLMAAAVRSTQFSVLASSAMSFDCGARATRGSAKGLTGTLALSTWNPSAPALDPEPRVPNAVACCCETFMGPHTAAPLPHLCGQLLLPRRVPVDHAQQARVHVAQQGGGRHVVHVVQRAGVVGDGGRAAHRRRGPAIARAAARLVKHGQGPGHERGLECVDRHGRQLQHEGKGLRARAQGVAQRLVLADRHGKDFLGRSGKQVDARDNPGPAYHAHLPHRQHLRHHVRRHAPLHHSRRGLSTRAVRLRLLFALGRQPLLELAQQAGLAPILQQLLPLLRAQVGVNTLVREGARNHACRLIKGRTNRRPPGILSPATLNQRAGGCRLPAGLATQRNDSQCCCTCCN